MYWLAKQDEQAEINWIRRFSPRYWTVNFPRPMVASAVTSGTDVLVCNLVFYRKEDLCGLIWESEDRHDHPLLKYETRRDYSHTVLSFRWQSSGIAALDHLHGPTLTIEGRDPQGNPRTWYVRLANYATGTVEDAEIHLDFDNLVGGFTLPAEADPVWPGDIDRLFISLVPPDYDGSSIGALSQPVEAEVTVSDIRVEGSTSTLRTGDSYVLPHPLRICNGYDDSYHLTPERVIWNMIQLGYRDIINHYVGMSHYFTLAWSTQETRFVVDPSTAVNAAAVAWHRDFLKQAKLFGYEVILSLSYEILAEHMPSDWRQLAHDGSPALTGWEPPSCLIAPTNPEATAYLGNIFDQFAGLADEAGLDIRLQIGEPWWWVSLDEARVPHFYDPATMTLYETETGLPVPDKHQSAFEGGSPEQQHYLDWLGVKLGQSTLGLRDGIRANWPSAQVGLLFYLPQVLVDEAPMLQTVNYPVTSWQMPAFDYFQIEDYDFIIDGHWKKHHRSLDLVVGQLGYDMADLHYFAGFNLSAETPALWRNIDQAARDGFLRSFEEVFVWAWPQVVRDGFVYNEEQEQDMSGFHEVRFPDAIGFGAGGGPVFSTAVAEMASGYEQRNRDWAEARLTYDVGSGLRSEDDLAALIAFFRGRAGRAFGFRFRDWTDYKSCLPSEETGATDQVIAVGDGEETEFQLLKIYQSGEYSQTRNIAKPVAETVRIAIDSIELTEGWQLDETRGLVSFDEAPAENSTISAGFEFDVPVRFAEDSLSVTLETFRAGQVPSISLIEVRL
ncbi:TIGR02217 family protein [Emcibacter sp.]|uniref:phage distal tail protein, Rcc01695 family n=1 Tax=Emcibacter sp. TaxID=1979954 RepID=UPI003A9536A7